MMNVADHKRLSSPPAAALPFYFTHHDGRTKNKEQIETYLLKKRPVLLFQVALEEFLVMT
jgi:hypothetical protein